MNERLHAAKIVSTHGIRGEVKAYCYTDSPLFFENVKNIITEPGGAEFKLIGARAHKGGALLKLSGIDSIEQAQMLVGKDVFVSREENELPEGQYYIVDIVGCRVVSDLGEDLGYVKDVFQTGSNDVFEVTRPNGKMAYIPNIHDIVKNIDVDNKIITIHVIEGLIDDEN